MKIWLLTTEYPPSYGGGIATYCHHTARMLTSYGHQVTVITPDSCASSQVEISVDGLLTIVRFRPGHNEIYRYMGYAAALSWDFSEVVEQLIDKMGPPDIVEAQEYLGIAYFLLQKKKILWPKLADIPIILTLHTPKFLCDLYDRLPAYRFSNFWIGEMERFAIRAADAIICPSRYLLDELRKHIDLSEVESFVIPNPFAFDGNCENIKSDLSDVMSTEVIFLGRLEHRKGVIPLLRYFKNLVKEQTGIRLILIGGDTFFHPKDMMLSDYLHKHFDDLFSNGRVIWEGKLSPVKLKERLLKARTVIVPSLFENFPYAVVESMALGKVVLVSDSGGHREIVEDGKSGFIFFHDSPSSFKQKMLQILELSKDRSCQIGTNAKARIKELCAYEAVYPAKIGVFERLTHKKDKKRFFPFIRGPIKINSFEVDSATESKKGLLSIVIPYYNMGRYVKETVESVFRSLYPQKEVIIVNDGSDDAYSIAILHQIERDYPVYVVHKNNEGLALARNTGAIEARGEFIAFLDADDLVDPEYYSWAIQLLNHYKNVSFVGCWTQYFGANEGIWPTWNPEPPYLLVHNTINSSGLVFRRADFLRYGLNDPDMEYGMEDYECIIRLVKYGCRGIVIPKPFFKYRVRPDSMSRQFNRSNVLYLLRLISEKHRDWYREYVVDVVNLLNSNGPGYLYDNPTRDLPPVGFVHKNINTMDIQSLHSVQQLPVELKEQFLSLWQNPTFRKAVQVFFKLRLYKIFKKR